MATLCSEQHLTLLRQLSTIVKKYDEKFYLIVKSLESAITEKNLKLYIEIFCALEEKDFAGMFGTSNVEDMDNVIKIFESLTSIVKELIKR